MKFLPPLVFMPFPLYPAGLLFHVVVFITKSNILLCRHCHLSPPACDFPCMCVCRPMHNESLGPSDGVMTRRLTDTKAHVQKSSCFIVCGRTELCFLHGSSKQQRLKCGETGGVGGCGQSKKNETQIWASQVCQRFRVQTVYSDLDGLIDTLCQTHRCECIHTHIVYKNTYL